MKKRFMLAGLLAILLISMPIAAQDKVVVIPLFEDASNPLANVVTVAKSGGDFTSPRDAVNSITDASENNPYLVVIAPGRYEVQNTLVMKPWVSISGSGRKVTTIYGSIGTIATSSSAIIRGADNATLSNIYIRNYGPPSNTTFSLGIYCYGNDLTMKNVRVKVFGGPSGADHIRAIHALSSSHLTLNDVEVKATGTDAVGLYHGSTSNSMVNNSILDGTGSGIRFGSSGARIKNTYIIHGVEDDPAGTQCVETYDWDFNPVGC